VRSERWPDGDHRHIRLARFARSTEYRGPRTEERVRKAQLRCVVAEDTVWSVVLGLFSGPS
jgi:hypothetical protein